MVGEWLRGWLMGGFPWGLLGYSQAAQLPVIQIAELGGVYAVSFLIVAVNAALAGLLAIGPRARVAGRGGDAGPARRRARVRGRRHRSGERGERRFGGGRGDPAVDRADDQVGSGAPRADHGRLRAAHPRGRPRPARGGALAGDRDDDLPARGDPALLERLRRLSEEVGTPILVGSIDRREQPREQFLNSAFLLTGQGITGKYDKIHLVPFGEYVPLASLLGFVKGWAEFISEFGTGDVETVFPLPGAPFGTVICYEVIFPELFRGFVVRGAAFMANITNDAWFGETSGPWQHLGMLPLRAVEHRVAIARAANTGVSAFVEPTGRIGPTLPLLERGVLHRRIPLRDRATLYTRFGDWLVYACAGLGAAGVALALFRRSPASC